MYPHKILLLFLSVALVSISPAIKIDLRYDFDDAGFFENPEARAAVEACARFFEELLLDDLERIDAASTSNRSDTWSAVFNHPSNGASTELVDLVVPANTLIVYLGARNVANTTIGAASTGFSGFGSASFLDTIVARGEAGGRDRPAIDYGPWGGSISFDLIDPNDNPRVWNFSLTETGSSGEIDFVGVALHEFCHLLGIGASNSWDDLASDTQEFFGPASIAANGGNPLFVTGDKGHWSNNPPDQPNRYFSEALGSFGTPHGFSQRVLMDPFATGGNVQLPVLSDLEIGGLVDIGWEIALPVAANSAFGSAETVVTVPTNTNFEYQLERSDLLSGFQPVGAIVSGNGFFQNLSDRSPPDAQAFYRVRVDRAGPVAQSIRVANQEAPSGFESVSWFWQSEGCCIPE